MVDTTIAGTFCDTMTGIIMKKYQDTTSDQVLFAASILVKDQVRAES